MLEAIEWDQIGWIVLGAVWVLTRALRWLFRGRAQSPLGTADRSRLHEELDDAETEHGDLGGSGPPPIVPR